MDDIKKEFWKVAQENLDREYKYMKQDTKDNIINDRWDLFVHSFVNEYALNYAWGNWTKRR
jgi:hypothetical protein